MPFWGNKKNQDAEDSSVTKYAVYVAYRGGYLVDQEDFGTYSAAQAHENSIRRDYGHTDTLVYSYTGNAPRRLTKGGMPDA